MILYLNLVELEWKSFKFEEYNFRFFIRNMFFCVRKGLFLVNKENLSVDINI